MLFADTNNLSYKDMQDKNTPAYQQFTQDLQKVQQSGMLEKMDKFQTYIRQKYPDYDPNMCQESVDFNLKNRLSLNATEQQIAEIQNSPNYELLRTTAIQSCREYILKRDLMKVVGVISQKVNEKSTTQIDYATTSLVDFPYVKSLQNQQDKIIILFNEKVSDFRDKKLVLIPTLKDSSNYKTWTTTDKTNDSSYYELWTINGKNYDYLESLEPL